ncbi:Mur ligase [Coraliomargarita sinensis]|uniref:Mur ligase n=1 Tax=Coraliomargarita sinensis TaxID=2174842 RepID=A0A317ZK00_9BACT|nr:Mur ligase family protein [Coraliomargarita sinensis]PXA04268.1 Mur ligase [Coraliomargarita sinensis]
MRVYFMGICGTAMGNAALLLKEQGHEVLGADSGIYPPMSDVLADAGIEVLVGFSAERLAELKPDQIVIGNAMSRGNVEVEWVLDQSDISYVSLPQLFHQTILAGRRPVVIAGTHGKTTTSTLTAYLLKQTGARPGWLIGGLPNDLSSGACLGEGRPFVIEGDEYDSAFFDKRSKFIHYRPQVAVLNNLEFDHADIFRDLEDVKRTFRHFLRIVPGSGHVLVNTDDENLTSLLPVSWTQVHRVGTGPESDLLIRNFRDSPEGASFDLVWKEKLWAQVGWSMHGLFNARNAAMAALAAALAEGLEDPTQLDLSSLDHFNGVKRRQDVLARTPAWTVIEDFAHHPTAVAGAIEALRAAYPEATLTACFEPRSNSAVTKRFESGFTEALSGADRVYLGPVHRAERIPPEERLDTGHIASRLAAGGLAARAFDENSALLEQVQSDMRSEPGGLIVYFTNGSFDAVPKKTAEFALGGLDKV